MDGLMGGGVHKNQPAKSILCTKTIEIQSMSIFHENLLQTTSDRQAMMRRFHKTSGKKGKIMIDTGKP